MRILEKNLRKGIVKLMPETIDDLWLLHNIIMEDDVVIARTTRDVKSDDGKRSRRLPMTLAVKVKHIEFHPFTNKLRIRGIVIEGPEEFGVKGHYHTLSIGTGTVLTIVKEEWPSYILKKIDSLSRKKADILLIALDYDEIAIALLAHQGMHVILEKTSGLPGKDAPNYSKLLDEYIEEVCKTIVDYIDRYGVKAVIIASPGNLKNYVGSRVKEKHPNIVIIYDTVSTGGKTGLHELMRRESILEALKDLEVINAQKVLNMFMKYLATNDSMIAYGVDEVYEATKYNAIDKLVVLDELLRSLDDKVREKVTYILDEADKRKAEIIIVSHNTDVGKQIKSLGGIIAVLRFPLDFLKKSSQTNSL